MQNFCFQSNLICIIKHIKFTIVSINCPNFKFKYVYLPNTKYANKVLTQKYNKVTAVTHTGKSTITNEKQDYKSSSVARCDCWHLHKCTPVCKCNYWCSRINSAVEQKQRAEEKQWDDQLLQLFNFVLFLSSFPSLLLSCLLLLCLF